MGCHHRDVISDVILNGGKAAVRDRTSAESSGVANGSQSGLLNMSVNQCALPNGAWACVIQ